MTVPEPPEPFDPEVEVLGAGTLLFRVGSTSRSIAAFNPGPGPPSRFAFFGAPRVPVLYAAQTERAAVAETLLHDIALTGGSLTWDVYSRVVMGRLRLNRPISLASLQGLGLRRLGVEASEVTDTPASTYGHTVAWAAAAHAQGLDGVAWTSRLCNDSEAVVLFGDRCEDAVEQDVTFGRHFTSGTGLDWLIDTCAPLRVDVLPPPPA